MKRLLLRSKNFEVYEDAFSYNDLGEKRTLRYIEQSPVAIAIPILNDGRIVMVEHWRPILNLALLECPGGKADIEGESLEDAMLRELAEETGFEAATLELMGGCFSSVGTSTEKIYSYIARGLEPVDRSAEDAHPMKILTFREADLRKKWLDGKIEDGKTYIALSHYFTAYQFNV